MSFMDSYDLDAVPPMKLLPAGTEVKLQVIVAELKESKKGGYNIRVLFKCTSDHNALGEIPNIYHYFSLPKEDDSDLDKNNKLRRIKDFKEACAIPIGGSGVNLEAWPGSEIWAVLNVENFEGNDSNKVKNFIRPKR